jgi:hypothetical protein
MNSETTGTPLSAGTIAGIRDQYTNNVGSQTASGAYIRSLCDSHEALRTRTEAQARELQMLRDEIEKSGGWKELTAALRTSEAKLQARIDATVAFINGSHKSAWTVFKTDVLACLAGDEGGTR